MNPSFPRKLSALIVISMCAALAMAQPETVDYYQRGQVKEQQGDMDGAVAAYTRAIEINPKSAALYTARASARDHNYQAALADFNRAIELDPKYAPAYNYRGLAKMGQLDWRSALADYDRAIELNPKYLDAFVNRAEARGSLKVAADELRLAGVKMFLEQPANSKGPLPP